MIDISQASAKWWRVVGNTELRLDTERAGGRLRNQFIRVYAVFSRRWWWSGWVSMFGRMRVRALDLDEAF